MATAANVGFELKTVLIPIASITLRSALPPEVRKSRKYRQIAASIAHVGLVEPLLSLRLRTERTCSSTEQFGWTL